MVIIIFKMCGGLLILKCFLINIIPQNKKLFTEPNVCVLIYKLIYLSAAAVRPFVSAFPVHFRIETLVSVHSLLRGWRHVQF